MRRRRMVRLLVMAQALCLSMGARAQSPAPPRSRPMPEAAPFPPPPAPRGPPPIVCAETASLPTAADGEREATYDRTALRQWDAVYAQCPTAANLYQLATATEAVGRSERSVVLMESASELLGRFLAQVPDTPVRAAVQARQAALAGRVRGLRARPLLVRAHQAEKRGDFHQAVERYDEYLAAAGDDPDRGLVVAERERCLFDQRHAAWAERDRARRTAGIGLLATGAVVAAAGGVVWALAIGQAKDARHSDTLAAHQSAFSSAQTQQTVGVALVAIGGAAAVAGVVDLVIGRRGEPARAAPQTPLSRLWLAPTGLGLVAGGGF